RRAMQPQAHLLAHGALKHFRRYGGHLPEGVIAQELEPVAGLWAGAWELSHAQRRKVGRLFPRRDAMIPIRLGLAGTDLGDQLVGTDRDRARQAELLANGVLDMRGNPVVAA